MSDGRLSKFGSVASFDDLRARFSSGAVAPLLRTVEAWLRAERDVKRARGDKMTETAEHAETDELRGVLGNGFLSGRFNNGFN